MYNAIRSGLKFEIGMFTRQILQGDMEKAQIHISKVLEMGYSYTDILSTICDEVYTLPLHDSIKAGIISLVSDIDYSTMDSRDRAIQIDNLIYQLIHLSKTIIT